MKGLAAAYLVAGFGAVAHCATGLAEEPTANEAERACEFCEFGKTVARDTREVFTEPVRWQGSDWGSVAWKSALVAGSIAWLDKPAHDYLQRHRSDGSQRVADIFEPFGAEYALGTLAGFALVGFAGDRPTARAVALDGTVSSLITSALIVPVLKFSTGRSRPNAEQGPHDFHPFSGGESFPSGHTAEAFTLATSIAENYRRPWISGLSYGIAGLVGYARMEHDAHWLSDVTASAFIGIGVAREVTKLERARRGIAFTPFDEPGGRGIRISVSF
jgi:membrane-associated phospholipid phosphatase